MASPRLLLFGTPGAGKSALLAAFAEAAPALQVELIDESPALQRFRVHPAEKVSGPFASDFTVLDCSGKAALAMLQADEPFAKAQPMKKPILDADAVVLVVDVSASKKQLNDDFRQAARWLKSLHEFRGRRTDIADLPVYVVLTKCDLLSKKEDTQAAWTKRLDDAKRQYDDNFRKFLKQHGPGFGTIKLAVLATSIKQPIFADKPAKTKEPFGVAELFRDCVIAASDFQERRHVSQGRLQNVLVGLFGLVALLVASVSFLSSFQVPSRTTTLDEKLQFALPKKNATSVERLAGTVKKLEDRQKRLTDIEEDAEFSVLAFETRDAVSRSRQEIAEYLRVYQDSQTILKQPHLAKNDAELKELEKGVREFALPEERAKDWEGTRLGQRLKHVRGEYETLQAEFKKEESWLRGQIEENENLLKVGNDVYGMLLNKKKDAPQEAKTWHKKYQAQLNAKPPTPRDDNVPGVSRLIYEDLGKFEPVRTAQKDWKTSKDDLTNISALIQKKL